MISLQREYQNIIPKEERASRQSDTPMIAKLNRLNQQMQVIMTDNLKQSLRSDKKPAQVSGSARSSAHADTGDQNMLSRAYDKKMSGLEEELQMKQYEIDNLKKSVQEEITSYMRPILQEGIECKLELEKTKAQEDQLLSIFT